MINFVTPGYATAVFVTASGIQRIRTTAESHRRIAIVEVMGRHSGFIALGSAYGQPDLVLVPGVADQPRSHRRAHPSTSTTSRRTSSSSAAKASSTSRDRNWAPRRSRPTRPATPSLGGAAEVLRHMLVGATGRQLLQGPAARHRRARGDLHSKDRSHAARRPAADVRPVPRGATRRQGRRSARDGAEQLRRHPAVDAAEGPARRFVRRQRLPRSLGAHPRAPPPSVVLRCRGR